MKLTIPIYVEEQKIKGGGEVYVVRPVFQPVPVRRGEQLERAMWRLRSDISRALQERSTEPSHETLANMTYAPTVRDELVEVAIHLRKRVIRATYLFVVFDAFDRQVAMTPSLHTVWFTLERGQLLADRASEALTQFFREQEADDWEDGVTPETTKPQGRAFTSTLELDVRRNQILPKPPGPRLLGIGAGEQLDGARELEKVGRNLNTLYPDDLDRAVLREPEVTELLRVVGEPEVRPILLLGPRGVGKTTLIHEAVYRAIDRRNRPYSTTQNAWLLSPQRLISGMSYVGQWENRVLAILDEVRKRRHALVIDDVLGLFRAGVTRDSDLAVAHVLKSYLERTPVRIVAEMTPEAFRVLRELDRGFADMFHVIPLRPPTDDDALEIAIHVARHLETRFHCRFGLDALPALMDLQRRYDPEVSQPGKVVRVMRQLALKLRRRDIGRNDVLDHLQDHSGVSLRILDDRQRLRRNVVQRAMSDQIIGQPQAVDACADVVTVAKARLSDPNRPLATLLFLGPTGVGKTQTAKALATFLFGAPEKLLRFDMNEFVEGGAVSTLIGTFAQPDGRLTSAVRRQPFCVLLLDEIEKAHPAVLDLLLGVLGEGRLTDAHGRTADFTNAIIIMTSNLGVREAGSQRGFLSDAQAAEDANATFVRAAERYFRPEFFNRIDRIIPFGRLGESDIAKIARLLINDVFQREGLVRRRTALRIEREAMARIVKEGHDPLFGARALKRAVERGIVHAVSDHLAALAPDVPTLVSLCLRDGELTATVQPLIDAKPAIDVTADDVCEQTPAADVLDRLHAALRHLRARIRGNEATAVYSRDTVNTRRLAYVELRQRVDDFAARLDAIEGWRAGDPPSGMTELGVREVPRLRARISLRSADRDGASRSMFQQVFAEHDVADYLHQLALKAEMETDLLGDALVDLVREFALIDLLADDYMEGRGEQAVLAVRGLEETPWNVAIDIYSRLRALFTGGLGLDVDVLYARMRPEFTEVTERGPSVPGLEAYRAAILIKGPAAARLARLEAGTHLVSPAHKSPTVAIVNVRALQPGDDAQAVMREMIDARDLEPGQVVRVYDRKAVSVDVRTGELVRGLPDTKAMRGFLLSQLPVPAMIAQGDMAEGIDADADA